MPSVTANVLLASILGGASASGASVEPHHQQLVDPHNLTAQTLPASTLLFGQNFSAAYVAFLGDDLDEVDVSKPLKRFNGFYVGMDAGLNRNQLVSDQTNTNFSGFVFGFHGGHRTQFDNGFVVGVDATFGRIAGSPQSFRIDNGAIANEIQNNFTAATELQLGFVYGEKKKNLFYFGLGYNRFSQTILTESGDGGITTSGHGLQYSLGFEWSLSDKFRLRFNTTLGGETNVNGLSTRSTVGFSYRF